MDYSEEEALEDVFQNEAKDVDEVVGASAGLAED